MTRPRDDDADGPPRGRPRDASARSAIIGATLRLLAERGFGGTTMAAIATEAGVGRNTIYRRWPSKEELVADALRELAPAPDVPDPDAGLYDVLLAWMRGYAGNFADPVLGRILPGVLGELGRNPAFAEVYAERVVRPRRRALVDLLTDAQQRGAIRPELPVEPVADLLAAPPFLRPLPLGLPRVGERYADELLETLWRGIGPR